ncbi:Transcriptional regulator SlyA [Vibrio quintilis]|uniref:Transcriptional regulator SlyA n=1 Tax=Vibrio quintilis TaxID=1117707 RepID=A0A1M7Z0H6_9VIBR|nr:Transcriptional regulator SlyA [Vibrio quintilis]
MDDPKHLKNLSPAEQLGRTARLWRAVADRDLASLELTYSRWTALWKLMRLGDNVSQKTLAESLEIELGSLMRTLNQLEGQGLIERHCNEEDKRARIISLTDRGKDVMKTIESRVLRIRRNLMAGIDEEELNQLRSTLEKIEHNALAYLSNEEGKKS